MTLRQHAVREDSTVSPFGLVNATPDNPYRSLTQAHWMTQGPMLAGNTLGMPNVDDSLGYTNMQMQKRLAQFCIGSLIFLRWCGREISQR